MTTLLMAIQFIVCLGLIVAVVLQESKSEGLGSIGGGGGNKMFFGQAKGIERILETATTYLAIGFMVLSVVLSLIS